MQQFCPYGSVRALGNQRPYRDKLSAPSTTVRERCLSVDRSRVADGELGPG